MGSATSVVQHEGTVASEMNRADRAALVVNTAARSGAEAYDSARRLLVRLGVPIVATHPVNDPSRLGEVVAQVAADGCDLIVLGGGDGTLSTALDHLVRHRATLGVLPLGTANDLARTLQIPTNLSAACEVIAHGKVVDIDLGLVGERHFLNVASLGLSVAVTQDLTPGLKQRLGPFAYPVAMLRTYRDHVPFEASLEFPDSDHEPLRFDDLLQVAVGNGRYYGGGNAVSPTAGIDDQKLDVYAIRTGRLHDYVRIARALRDGSFVEHVNVVHVTTGRVLIRTDPVQLINVDGEVVTSTPQMMGVHVNALDVLVPQRSTTARLDGPGNGATG